MLSSGEVAQMFASQQAAFAQQAVYAQQITPAAGLGAWGSPGGGMQRMPGMPGMPGAQVVNYGPSGFSSASYGGGNRVAGSAMAGLGGLATAGGAALGMASRFGMLGRMGAAFDPIAGGMAGFARAGMMGAGVGAAIPLALGGLAAHTVGSFVGGGQQQQAIGGQLSSYGFANQASRTGQGFTRDDAQQIGTQVRTLAHMPELMTSVQELTALLPKLKSTGVMQGVRDATEFSTRFKESVKTIRDVSKMLGTTMEEATEFFSHSRSVGFLGKQAQLQNVMNAKFTMASTGMDQGQFMQMQRAGADMGTQMGISRGRGARAVTNIAQTLGAGLEGGQISQETLSDMTGMEGPEAIKAASERMAGMTAQMAKGTAVGKLSMFGLAKFDESGKYIGMDEDLAKRYARGEVSSGELKRKVSGFTREQKMAVSAHTDSMAMDFAAKAGPGGIARFAEEVLGERGYKSENAQLLGMKKMFGEQGESTFELMQQMKGVDGGQGKEAMAARAASEASIRERTDPSMIWKRIKTKLHGQTFGHVEQYGAEVFSSIGKTYDSWIDDLVGRHVVTMSKEGAEKLARSFQTESGKKELMDSFSAAAGVMKGGLGPKGPSAMGRNIAAGMLGSALGGPIPGMGLFAAKGVKDLDSFTGGMLLGGMGSAVDAMGRKFIQGFGSTETSTGRSDVQQQELMMNTFGVGTAGELDSRAAALQKFGKGMSSGEREAFEDAQLAANMEGAYSAADADKKLDILSEKIGGMSIAQRGRAGRTREGRMGGVRSGTADSDVVSRMKKEGLISETASQDEINKALALATMSGKDVRGALGKSLGGLDLKSIGEQVEKARAGVDVAFGSAAGEIKDKPGVAAAMSSVMSGSPAELKELAKILNGGDKEAIAAALEKHKVKPSEIDSFRKAVDMAAGKVGSAKGVEGQESAFQTIKASLDMLNTTRMGADIAVGKTKIMSAADHVEDADLKKAMTSYGLAETGEQLGKAQTDIKSALHGLRERMKREKDPDKRRKLAESAGLMGIGLEDSLKTATGETGRQSVASLATKYGMSEAQIREVAGDMSGGKNIDVTATVVDKLKESAAVGKGVGASLQNKAATEDERSQKLLDALNGVKDTIERNSTVIQLMSDDPEIKDKARAKLKAPSEKPTVTSTGSATPGEAPPPAPVKTSSPRR